MPEEQGFVEKLIASLENKNRKKVISKGEFLIKEGDTERNIYLIESGAVRIFYLSEYEEHIIRFGYEGSLITSLSSFLKGTPSEFYIEAIRKTSMKVISKEDFARLVNENSENLRQYTNLLETLISQQIDREIDLLITSPTERLNRVLKRSPNLFQHVPLKYIASYLRMTPETLSRIRNS